MKSLALISGFVLLAGCTLPGDPLTNEEIVQKVGYCHSKGLEVRSIAMNEGKGTIVLVQCDPTQEWGGSSSVSSPSSK